MFYAYSRLQALFLVYSRVKLFTCFTHFFPRVKPCRVQPSDEGRVFFESERDNDINLQSIGFSFCFCPKWENLEMNKFGRCLKRRIFKLLQPCDASSTTPSPADSVEGAVPCKSTRECCGCAGMAGKGLSRFWGLGSHGTGSWLWVDSKATKLRESHRFEMNIQSIIEGTWQHIVLIQHVCCKKFCVEDDLHLITIHLFLVVFLDHVPIIWMNMPRSHAHLWQFMSATCYFAWSSLQRLAERTRLELELQQSIYSNYPP